MERRPLNIRKFDSALWRRFKIEALKQDRPVWEMLEEAVKHYLNLSDRADGRETARSATQ